MPTIIPELQDALRALCRLAEVCELRGLFELDADTRSALLLLLDGAESDGVVVDLPELGIMVADVDG